MIQFIRMGVVRHTWTSQKKISILNLQHFKTVLSYDGDFLHAGRHPYKEETDPVISSSLTVWFFIFDAKIISTNQIS